jgi:hypothetical protein
MRTICAICLAVALFVGCGETGEKPSAPDPFLGPSLCSSGMLRSINESESPEMGPGHACISCHDDSNVASGEQDAPLFAFAGTVYPTAHEPIDCIGSGAEGAQVELTDASGNVFTQLVNAAGNFSDTPPGFAYPYTAKVRFQGRERAMLEAQPIGDCNLCHTERGDIGASGRILLP